MAKNTTLKTRIQNRHDTEANWTTASNATKPFIPLKGEVIVYDPDTTNTSPRVKIGDGVTKVGDLAFVAGDISKYVTLDTKQTISGIKTFTNAMIVDSGEGIHFSGAGEKAGLPAIIRLRTTGNSASLDPTAYDVVFQNKAGTIALTSDIPDVSKYVALDTAQTITGAKTFSAFANFNNGAGVGDYGIGFSGAGTSGGKNMSIQLHPVGDTSTQATEPNVYDVRLQNKSGTVALLSDIPSLPTNYVTTDTDQNISGVKTFTGDVQLNGVGILSKVGNADSSYATILKGSGNVVEVGSTSYQTRIYSNGRISVYDYSTSPSTSEKIAYQSEIPTIPADNLTKSNFNTQMIDGFSLAGDSTSVVIGKETLDTDTNASIKVYGCNTVSGPDNYYGYSQINGGGFYANSSGGAYTVDIKGGTVSLFNTGKYLEMDVYDGIYTKVWDSTTESYVVDATYLTDKDLDAAPTKVKDIFVSSSWSTSSAAVDTQFGKYYKDVTIPNKNIINVRCVSTKGMSGITLDYAPEIKCNNRRTSDTNLRIYSNSQLEGAVIITLVGDTLPNKFSKTNATLSASSWTTSSATVDTQFATYYTDVTVPAGDVMNIRILSNEDVTGISTAAYYPEVWSDNRKINSTTLRIYSNKQVAGSVTILTMEV